MSGEAERISAGLAQARASNAEAGWYGFVSLADVEALASRVTRLEDALREIVEETSYVSGGNYAPDIARWARDALLHDTDGQQT